MRKRIFAVLLALLCLSGCGAPEAQVLPEEPSTPQPAVAYIPLDDRPVNADRVAYLASSLGYDLRMPEEDLYRTRLDEQPRNKNGSGYGDRAALYEWILTQENTGCDRYVLSLDQLLSGGLVNSRSFAGEPVTLSNGSVLTETQLIDGLLALLSQENNQVYLLDTVMRLAPTVGYDGWDLSGYEALRAYGMESRPTLPAQQLTVEHITANYGMSADQTPLSGDSFGITTAQIERYHAARGRKLSLISHALAAASAMKNVHFLIGVDDSAPSASIQTNELAFLRQEVAGQGAVLSGADEMGMMAFCRLYASEGTETPLVRVRYFGDSEEKASSDYDHQPMTEIVAQHLEYLGAQAVETGADLELLVLTRPADTEQSESYINALIKALQENQKAGVPTVLMDAAKNQYGAAFQTKLIKQTDLGFLLGYAGFYDLANATGISLSNGLARWLCLSRGGPETQAQQDDFIRTLADSLLKDLCYKNQAKVETTLYIKNELQGDPDNFCRTDTDPATVLAQAEEYLLKDTSEVLKKNLSRSSMLVTLDGQTAGLGNLRLSGFSFPWLRVFEVRMTIHIDS